jgi:hypothetical protein
MLEVRYAQLAFAEQHVDEALARVRPAIERLRGAGVPAVAMVYALNELARMTARDHPGDAVPIYDEALRFHLQRESRALAEDLELLTGIGNASLAARRPAAALGWFARLPEAATRLAELRAQLERAPHR